MRGDGAGALRLLCWHIFVLNIFLFREFGSLMRRRNAKDTWA